MEKLLFKLMALSIKGTALSLVVALIASLMIGDKACVVALYVTLFFAGLFILCSALIGINRWFDFMDELKTKHS